MQSYSLRFISGMVLLLTNNVVGWLGLIGGSYFGKKTGKKIFLAAGTGLYALSWGMLALGVYLAGPQGVELVKKLFKAYKWQAIIAGVIIVSALIVYHFTKRSRSPKVEQKKA